MGTTADDRTRRGEAARQYVKRSITTSADSRMVEHEVRRPVGQVGLRRRAQDVDPAILEAYREQVTAVVVVVKRRRGL